MKKYAFIAVIIVGLLVLSVFFHRRPGSTNSFYLRSSQTGKLIGPVSLPKGHLPPPLDEQAYIIADPTESELKILRRLQSTHVIASLNEVPLSEALNHILIAYGINAFRIEIAGMPRVSIDARDTPLYEVLYNITSQADVYISIENGTIVFSEKELKVPQALENNKESDADQSPLNFTTNNRRKEAIESESSTVRLNAKVVFTGAQLIISNNDSFDWINVELHIISEAIEENFNLKVPTIPSGETYTVTTTDFASKDGTRFNPFNMKIKRFQIQCDISTMKKGTYFASF